MRRVRVERVEWRAVGVGREERWVRRRVFGFVVGWVEVGRDEEGRRERIYRSVAGGH